jgi:SAM-dependent methyltransferase
VVQEHLPHRCKARPHFLTEAIVFLDAADAVDDVLVQYAHMPPKFVHLSFDSIQSLLNALKPFFGHPSLPRADDEGSIVGQGIPEQGACRRRVSQIASKEIVTGVSWLQCTWASWPMVPTPARSAASSRCMNRLMHSSVGAVLLALALFVPLPAQEPDHFAVDIGRLTKAIGLAAGQTVADIGAGQGELTLLLARLAGPSGRVFSTELNTERVGSIRKAAADAGLKNVTVLEGHVTRTNLPEKCCDALVTRFVYHHFGDPAAMNTSLFQSVKPGGHVAVIDFAPPGKEAATAANRGDKDTHGVLPATVIRELTAAGFELVSQEQEAAKEGKGFLVVVRRPI